MDVLLGLLGSVHEEENKQINPYRLRGSAHKRIVLSVGSPKRTMVIFPIPEGETDEVCQLSIWSDANNRNAFCGLELKEFT